MVTRFDRYMLSQFMVLFGFFALVLVSIFWINKAVRMFDRLISDGQSAFVFLEFTALTLPAVIAVVLPIASFAAAVYVTNRLSTESELTVMQATGYSPWRLARPVLYFGIIVAVLMSLLAHVLVPISLHQLELRKAEVSRNVTAKLLTEGEFLHPASGVTVYIREITPEGELRDVFLSDRRDPVTPVTYTSNRAYLVRDEEGTKLVMVSGLAQTLRRDGNRLFTTHFDDFSYDISALVSRDAIELSGVGFQMTPDLIARPVEIAVATRVSEGEVMMELHNRFAQPLLCIVSALIGFATLLLGGYSRFGVWWQILTAFVLLVGVKLVEGVVVAPVLTSAKLWPMIYLPPLAGFLLAGALLHLGSYPGIFRLLLTRLRGMEGTA